jgi:hypothetical protein
MRVRIEQKEIYVSQQNFELSQQKFVHVEKYFTLPEPQQLTVSCPQTIFRAHLTNLGIPPQNNKVTTISSSFPFTLTEHLLCQHEIQPGQHSDDHQ